MDIFSLRTALVEDYFATGGTPEELIAAGLLEPECERIFRVKEHADDPAATRSPPIAISATPSRPLGPGPPMY